MSGRATVRRAWTSRRGKAPTSLEIRIEALGARSGLHRLLPGLDGRSLLRLGIGTAVAAGAVAAWNGAGAVVSGAVALAVGVGEYLALDTVAGVQGERTRRRLLELVGLLNRWCAVREDLLYAFEKSVESGLGEPMKGHVRDLVTRIRGGLGVERSLELFGDVADQAQFREFVTSVRFNLRYRGDLSKFLEGTESQLGRIEEEYNRRRISTSRDRAIVLAVVAAVPPVALSILSGPGSARDLFLGTSLGNIAAYVAAGLYLSGGYLLLSASGVRG